jgi:2',3'-cyclic-nucleotide 2'-phosphodiesterase (5'-nucleotidase family)
MQISTLTRPKLKMVFWALSLILFSACSPNLNKSSSSQLLAVDDKTEANHASEELIAPYKEKLDAQMNAVVARSEEELAKGGRGETALGNFVADQQLEFSREAFDKAIDISVVNNGGLRNSLPKGDITVGNVFELLPFENFIYILALSAGDVHNLAEYAIKGRNLGLSGMAIESQEGELTKVTVNDEPIEEGRTYLLAINDYLANGGDRMDFLIEVPRVEESTVLMREMLLSRLKEMNAAGKQVEAKVEGRQKIN